MQTILVRWAGVLAGLILQVQASVVWAGEPETAVQNWPAAVIRTDACPGSLTLIDNPHTVRYLEMLLPEARLQHLELQGCPLSVEACRMIGACSNLEVLELAGTRVDDRGVAQLVGLTDLRRLDLRGALISDVALKHVEQLAGLEYLDLRATRVSTDAVLQLQARRPKLMILSDRGCCSVLADNPSESFTIPQPVETRSVNGPAGSGIRHARVSGRHSRE